jgi:hypothetical protein
MVYLPGIESPVLVLIDAGILYPRDRPVAVS